MASKILTLLTLLTLLCFSTKPVTVNAISTQDLDALLTLLRANGHSLFANAISTSDLLFDLLSLPSLTLLAPTDPSLFALDMTQTPSFYLSTLRLHALPLRLSWFNLLQLPNGSSLPTLLPSRAIRVTRHNLTNVVLVAGSGGTAVQVVMPGLFYGSHVAVHGLAGMITYRFRIGANRNRNRTIFVPPVPRFPSTPVPRIPEILPRIPTHHSDRTDHNAPPDNRTVLYPPVSQIHTNSTGSSPMPKISATQTDLSNRTDTSPVPLPVLDGHSPAKLRRDHNVSTAISSEFTVTGDLQHQRR